MERAASGRDARARARARLGRRARRAASAATRWRRRSRVVGVGVGVGWRSPSRVGGASRVVCASAPSASTGWVGVRVVGSYGGAVSSGGGFYYHRRVRVRGAAPPLGPSRGGTRVAVVGGGFRDAYTLRCRLENASRAVLARYVDESQLECASPVHSVGAKAVGVSMNAQHVRAGGVVGCGGVVHVPAVGGGELGRAGARARGGRRAADGARRRGFSSASEALARAAVPRGRRVASRGVVERPLGRVRRARARSRVEATVEVSNNAREYTSASARLRLVSARVLGVQPWSGPRRRRDARARARARLAAVARGVPLRRRRGGGGASSLASSASASGASVSVARRRRVARRARVGAVGVVRRWVGVRVVGSYGGAVSSGGGFYYHRRVRARGAAPSLGRRAAARAWRWWAAASATRTRCAAVRECVARGARAVRRRVAARVRVAGALGRREGGGRVDERAAVRAGGVVALRRRRSRTSRRRR